MALMAEPREPEVARFIDSYKYDQEMSSRRNRFGGGTSLPLDSDGYEDKQRQLREERHKDWLQQQDKFLENPPTIGKHHRPPIYGPQRAADYEEEIQRMTDRYHNRYNEQRQMEQQKMEARRHQSPPRPAQPPGPQVDYNAQNDHARAEERRAYQDYMGKYQYPNAPSKPPIDYEENKRVLNEERKREYNELMEKKAKEERYWAMRGRPVTPPGGLNIGNYDRQIKETAAQRKKEYKEMLDQQKNEQLKLRAMDRVAEVSPKYVKYRDEERPLVGSPRDINYYRQEQQKEHMYLRARQEPEISVIDRNAQNTNPNYLANKPPPGPGYSRVRDEAFKNEPQSRPVPERPAHGQPPYPGEGPQFNDLEGQRPYMEPMERSRSPQNLPPRSPEKPANPNWLKVPLRDDERPEDLGTPLAFKTHSQPGKPLPPSDQQYNGPDYAQEGRRYENGPDGLFERADQAQEKPRSRRSLDVERKYSPSKPEQTMPGMQISPRRTKNTLYKDSEEVNTKRREASKDRQQEYNDYLRLKAEERRRQDEIKHQQQQSSKPSEIVRNPFYSSDDYEKFQREIQRKQAEDYRDFLAKKNTEVRKRDWNYEQNGVLELRGDDAVQSKQRELRAERQRDYNNYMSQVKPSSNRVWPEPDGKGALLVKKGEYENVRRMFDEERKQDYLNAMQKRREQRVSNPSRRHEFVDTASGPYGGLFHGLGEHGNRSEVLNRERQQEYNNMLDQYGKDRPSGRPNWAKETIPNDRDRGRSPMKNPAAADQYQQMLDEKRREEASRRRYEDPEYQSRLSQGRDRGEAGARYGY